jgi:AcrR family transcriptional regulator
MRLTRAERREQILKAAAETFVDRGGFAATSMEDVALAAGITRAILYRHFETKTALYQAAIDRAAAKLYDAATKAGQLHQDSIAGMLRWATTEPAAFRLLFHQAAREPEFRDDIDRLRGAMTDALQPHVPTAGGPWGRWAAMLATRTTIEAIMCWLEVGSPDPDQAAEHILKALDGVFTAASPHD